MLRPDATLIIIGGGFSGTLLAINLLRFGGPPATLIDREAGRIARGVAYSAAHPSQLLNVRAAGMSAFPDDPSHFARWAEREGYGATSFVPRAVFGRYLTESLAAERRGREDRLTLREGDACDLTFDGDEMKVRLADGERLRAAAAVLATGNLPPHTPVGIDPGVLPRGAYVDDPWRAEIVEGLAPDDTVLLLGTGLTAIDVALQLDAAGFAGRTIALSRPGGTSTARRSSKGCTTRPTRHCRA